MDFSEFKRRLGAEPLGGDPELEHARGSSPEFEAAAAEAERFETKLARALAVNTPDELLEDLQSISQQPAETSGQKGWWRMALAASVLIAVGAAGLSWKMNQGWASVEEYLVAHYRHDGAKVLALAEGSSIEDIRKILGDFDVEAAPALAEIVGVIKNCPTPDGKGVHMVLNTDNGPVTVIYMPETQVTDRQMLAFDGVEAVLVDLEHGSAAIIGSDSQQVASFYAMVQNSITPAS